MQTVTKNILGKVYKPREPWSHKGQYGKLLVITGSERHTGSPIFVGAAAGRAGCDLVYLIGPRRAMDIAAGYSPSLITQPLEGKELEMTHVPEVLEMINEVRADAVAIGPGLWRTPETRKAIIYLISKINLPMVVDADAIRAISAKKELLANKKIVLTPHDSEFRELTGVKISRENLQERIKTAAEETHKINCSAGVCPLVPSVVTLLKGHVDIITDGKNSILNKTGDPKMTKGGCGDTLTGICGAFLARGIDTLTAASAAAYINGRAGKLAALKYTEGLVAMDLVEEIPTVLKKDAVI